MARIKDVKKFIISMCKRTENGSCCCCWWWLTLSWRRWWRRW